MLPTDDILRALEIGSGAAIITDRQGIIEYATPGMLDLTQYEPSELIGQHTRIFKSDLNPPTMYDDLWETILAGKQWTGILRNSRKDGSTYLERMTVFPLESGEGGTLRFLATKAAAGLRQEYPQNLDLFAVTEKMSEEEESVLQTVVNLSSEFQSSLQMVLGFSQLLNDDLEQYTNGGQREYFDIVIRTVQRLLRTIEDTVLLARLETNAVIFEPVKINVAEELRQIVAKVFPLRDTEQVRFIKVIEDTGAEILVDRQSFSTIISHLLINAMKFTREGSITIGLQNQSNQAVVWVIDTGVGISEHFKQYLFQSFKQEELGFHKDFEGVGLGLAITKNLIMKMGGTLTYESYKGSGSTFIVSFPIVGWEERPPKFQEPPL